MQSCLTRNSEGYIYFLITLMKKLIMKSSRTIAVLYLLFINAIAIEIKPVAAKARYESFAEHYPGLEEIWIDPDYNNLIYEPYCGCLPPEDNSENIYDDLYYIYQ